MPYNYNSATSESSLLNIVVFVLVAVAALLVLYLLADAFYEVAKKKGHKEIKYFWLSFFFGISGYLLVIALPDRANHKESGPNN